MQVRYDPHARGQMHRRKVSEAQVEQALSSLDLITYLAPERQYLTFRAVIYRAQVDGRPIKVYVKENSDPPYVLTAAWADEEG